ncbi:MAG TPA: formyltransferase family protein [Candidatus Paceibacterota bacterium]
MRIAYCGYDFFYSCFEELLSQEHETLAIFSFPCDNEYDFNLRLETSAEKLGVPFYKEPISPTDINRLSAQKCDLIVAAAYPYKIPSHEGIPFAINVHPTLLPEGRGRWPLPWIILKGLTESGTTIHKISHDWDSGDILTKKKFKVTEEDNLETISVKSQIAAKEALGELLAHFEEHWESAVPQEEGSVWPFPIASDRTIVWEQSYIEIDRMIRAYGKFESYAKFNDRKWLIQDAICWPENHSHTPGTVVHKTDRELVIACKDGLVCLRHFREDLDSRVP